MAFPAILCLFFYAYFSHICGMSKVFSYILSVCILSATAVACVDNTAYKVDKTKTQGEKEPEKEPETTPDEKLPTDFLSIKETVAKMGAGWNLGNTLDSNSGDTTHMWIERWTERKTSDYETAWGQAVTTRALMKMLREAGFRTIRVPVTWWPHLGAKFEFEGNSTEWFPSRNPIGDKVDDAWMARVKEVVDYVLAEDMYCVLNVHHDTGTANTHWLIASEENHAQNSARFKSLWTQIAETFKDYDGRLVFEGYNEMTDKYDSWCFASFASPNHYDAAEAKGAYNAINAYAQDFVDAVRATGGNNLQRNLVVNTYAACSGDGDWNSHLLDPLKEMRLPEDKVKDRIALQVHYYPTFKTLPEGKASADKFISNINTHLVVKGAPIIVGEWGVGTTYEENQYAAVSFAEYFVRKAKENGIATIHWMGISDGADRAVPKFTQENLKNAIIRGATQ